jgi:hypothetical protein
MTSSLVGSFSTTVWSPTRLRSSAERMRASFYNEKVTVEKEVVVDNEEFVVPVQCPASPTAHWGLSLLGFISLLFNNRINLIQKSVTFL